MSEDLKRCPFCGGEAKITRPLAEGAEVCCKTCRATTWMCYPEERAIKRWNTRPEEDRLKAENERLKKALRQIVKIANLRFNATVATLKKYAWYNVAKIASNALANDPDMDEGKKIEPELKTESPNEAVLRLFKMWLHRKLEEDGCNMENISETKVNWDDWNEVSFCLKERG